ncbi:hypothetical protein D6C79_05701 [Aureobasidium pullulans]|nr:hypothetical protein D6C79_05701 [Aureobasidium pullulans]
MAPKHPLNAITNSPSAAKRLDAVSDVDSRATTTSKWQQTDPPFPLRSVWISSHIAQFTTDELEEYRKHYVEKFHKRIDDIESNDDDQQHTNGASVPVQALDRNANGVPLDATVINARGCKRTGGKRIAQRRVYGPQPYSLRQWQHELRYEENRLSSRHLLSHIPFSLLTLFSF